MTNITHIQFHIGDFLGGVMHMDGAEIGAYTMLIMAHYQAGKGGLPDDEGKLKKITRTNGKVWQRIRDTVLEKFYLEDGRWKNRRVIEEIEKIHSKAGPGRPRMEVENTLTDSSIDFQKPIEVSLKKNKPLILKETEKTNHKPITNNQKEKIYKKEKGNFEEFWSICPRKVGKGKAEEKYQIALREVEHEMLMHAMKAHRAEVAGKEKQFIPHPATWLHGKRYFDEITVVVQEDPEEWPDWKRALAVYVGDRNVKSWFHAAQINGNSITVRQKFQADKIKNEFMQGIEKALGKPYEIRVET